MSRTVWLGFQKEVTDVTTDMFGERRYEFIGWREDTSGFNKRLHTTTYRWMLPPEDDDLYRGRVFVTETISAVTSTVMFYLDADDEFSPPAPYVGAMVMAVHGRFTKRTINTDVGHTVEQHLKAIGVTYTKTEHHDHTTFEVKCDNEQLANIVFHCLGAVEVDDDSDFYEY